MKQISLVGKSRLILFLLPLILATVITPATAAGPSFLPGVKKGDQWTYGDWQLSCSDFCPSSFVGQLVGINSFQIQVQNVTGTYNVGAKLTFTFYNGSSTSSTAITNTLSSSGFTFLIAGGLTKGDHTYNSTFAPTINETVTRFYAGANRQVNVLDYTQQQSSFGNITIAFYWDQTTGAALEINERITFSASTGQTGGTLVLHARVTTTNLWTPALPDFSLSSTPLSPATINVGSSSGSTITLTSLQGLPGPEQLSAFVFPPIPGHPQPTVNPPTVPGTGSTTLSITTTASTVPGKYTVLVIANYTTVSHFITLDLSVTGPDFTVAVYPSSFFTPASSSQTAQVVLTSIQGFNAPVTLSSTITPQGGPTASFIPTTITVPANGKVNSTLTVTVPATVSTNYFTGEIAATSGSLSHSALFTVYVSGVQPPDFQISALPTTLTVNQGDTTKSLVTLSSLNGFAGTVHVTTSYDTQHLSVSPSKNNVTLTPSGTNSFDLTMATSQNTGTGLYQVIVTGNTGTTYHSVTIFLNVVTPSPFSVIATIKVGSYPGGVSFDPRNGYVYLTDLFSDTVSVIDGSTNQVIKTIQLPSGSQPGVTAFDSANGNIYVGDLATKTVTVINGTSNTIITTISVGARPIGIAVDSSNGNLYVVNQSDNTVSVVNATSNSVIKTTIVGTAPAGDVYDSTNKDIYVTNLSSNNVSVINGASNTVVAKVPTGSGPAYLAFDPRNGYIYVTNVFSNDVTIIDGSTNTVATTVSVGMWPSGAAFNPSNGYIYISDLHSNTVSVIDGSTNTAVGTVPVGNGPAGIDYDSANGYVYVANQNDNTVSVISSSSVVTKPDFKITANPSTLTIQPGQTLTTEITVTSLNGFTGAIQVSATYDPQHLAITPTSATMTLGGTGSMASFLMYVSTSIAQQGQYQIILSASNSNGTITRTTTLTVNVVVGGVAPPTITSVTGVTTNTHSTITIQGTGFGNTPPQTVTVFDGSIDTVEDATTPSIAIVDNCPSQGCAYGTWTAGHKVQTNANAIGIYLTSWSDTKIVIDRFGSALSQGTLDTSGKCTVSSGWGICVGDKITIEVWGPNNSGVATYTVTATQGTKAATSLSESCSTNSMDVGTFTTCTATATGDAPSGDVTFSTTSSSGTFTPTSANCTLHGGACSVTYGDTAASSLTATITASYSGDAYNTASSNNFVLNVNKPASTTATATSSLTVTNGQAVADQTSVTGISVTITGSGAGNGSPVAISTRDISSLSTGVGTVSLANAKYYDVLVVGINDGNANVCINYASASSSTTMQYWNGANWNSASTISVNGGTICGQIPVSALKGTNIAVGTSIQSVSPGPLGNSNLLLIIAGVVVAVAVVGAVAMVLLRRRGRATLSAQPITG